MTLPRPPVLVITDRTQCAEPLEARAHALFRGGCRWLSLREKDLAADARRALLERLIAIGREFGAVVGVHDDPEAAIACGCALHLPASGETRLWRGALAGGALIGRSCHDERELAAASGGGADYATLGPIFPTESKPGYAPAQDLDRLAAMAGRASIPVIALGGLTEATLPGLPGTAFAGIAVMGEAMRTSEPREWFTRIADLVPRKEPRCGPSCC